MPNYWYTLTHNNNFTHKNVVYGVSSLESVANTILMNLLDVKRENRLEKLLTDFNEDIKNVDALYHYLPDQYKQYASNVELLKQQMASLHEISGLYTISNIELAPDCYGCINDCGGQRDHMECPTGCLHDSTHCFSC